MSIQNLQPVRCSALAAAIFITALSPFADLRAQDPVIPTGKLMFRASSLEFRPDGTFMLKSVLDGFGEVHGAGTWKQAPGRVDLVGFKVVAGLELLQAVSVPLDGCETAGQYRYEVSGRQLRLSMIADGCGPRGMFLDKTRWAPPGVPNPGPPRTVKRTMFNAEAKLPPAGDGSTSWPSFRGPQASGSADGQQLPDRWNVESGENVLWRTNIPGLAHSSPIVWGKRLFVTSAISSRGNATFKVGNYDGGDPSDDTSSHKWVLYALDTATGRIAWQQTAREGEPRDKRHVKSTYASATPATDGRVVVASFGSEGLHAYTVEGTPLWKVDLGRMSVGAAGAASIEWGPASSPVIWDGLVIVQVDTHDDSFVVALSAATGEQVWKSERDEIPSWSTPTVVTTADGPELVVNGGTFARGYDPRTGAERWRVATGSGMTLPTPIGAAGLSIVTSGGIGSPRPIAAVRHGADGKQAWELKGRGPFTVTPLAYRGLLYVLANNGVLDAYDLQTGAEVYRARVPDYGSGFSASLVAADGKLYLSNEDGAIIVVAADRTFRHLATNQIGAPIMATPALSGGAMFVRTPGAVLAIGRATPAQESTAARVDQIFKAYDRQDSPGCALGVYRDGKIAYARGYGMADLKSGIPIGTNTVFDIGSTSKQFTAASILLLAQRGKVSLDDDVRKFIPELPQYQKPITVRHLLHHTSGLRDYIGLLNLMGHSMQGHTTAKQALDAIVRQKALNFEPGAEFLYSNSGYFLLAQIVERVSGQSLRAFAHENLFAPLGMRATYFHDDHKLVVPNRATGYARASPGFGIAMSNWEQTGDGAVNTTVEDLLRWDQNFYDQKVGGSAMLTDFLTRGRLNDGTTIPYASGLMTGTFRGLNMVSHGGSWAGYRAELVRFPDHQLSVATLCNVASANPTVMARAVAAVYLEDKLAPLPPPADPPATPAPAASPAPADAPPITEPLASYAGAYYSEELDRTFTLAVDDGRLVIRREGTSPMIVRRLPNHAFGGDGFSIRFTPDAEGRMTAFELNMGRVRGIRFVRKAESH